jgi:UDP:flavonoid glycosyltransferase YjiC (YdhE family)
MRILFASTRGAGHFNPMVPFIDSALRDGDEVLVAAPEELRETVEPAGYGFRPIPTPPDEELGPTWERVHTASAEEAEAIVVGEIFGRLNTKAALPEMRDIGEEWAPDLVVREPCEFSSAIVASELGIPQARVSIGLASTEHRLSSDGAAGVEEHAQVAAAANAGSPYLTMYPESFEDPGMKGPPDTRRYRDPATDTTPRPLEDWWAGDERPLVYITFGSVTATLPSAVALYSAALEAAAEVPARVLLTTGRKISLDELPPPPDNVHLANWVPQADAFAGAELVVCHGGAGTVLGALSAGLPQIVVPLFADQPPNARRVAEVGAGVVVEPLRDPGAALPKSIDPAELRDAIRAGLTDQGLRRGAEAIAAEMRRLPPVDGALRAVVRA